MINTKENKRKWVEKVKTIMLMGGKSEITFNNYRAHINRFLNYYSEKTNFNNIREEEILVFIRKNYLDLKKASSTMFSNL